MTLRGTRTGGLLRGALLAVALAALPASAGAVNLFGLVDTGELFVSSDLGTSWRPLATLPVHDATALVAGASSSELYLAAASGSVYRSTDGGAAWTPVGAIPASDVVALVGRPGELLALTSSGDIRASADGGATWLARGAIPAPDVVGAARRSSALFALTRSGTVLRSEDGGATWAAAGTLPVSDAVEIATLGGALYVLTGAGDVARSEDGGVSWSFIGTLSQVGMTSLLATRDALVACTAAGEAATSADGEDWAWRGTIGQLTVRALASDLPWTTGVGPEGPGRPALAGWPNPAAEAVTFALTLERDSRVTLRVLDATGREVARPLSGEPLPGGRTVRTWRPVGLKAGRYWLRAEADGRETVRPVVWIGR